jgi:hypothetical protein
MNEASENIESRSVEQRREVRFPASGEVQLWLDDESQREIAGHLVDVSASGFRASHRFASLSSGQVVRFRHLTAGGKARVIWNRIVGQKVETGFLIL